MNIFKNKRVLLTGHTGFKGAWMLQVLHLLGAEVKGYALAPEHHNDLYNQIKGDELCYSSIIEDISNHKSIGGEIGRFQPDFIFHFAAQALVRRSYDTPRDTFETNVMGTVEVLEAMRHLDKPCVGVIITTDKVYLNEEYGNPFVETDKLGGFDPYAASKAAAEMAILSYQHSYFSPEKYDKHQKSVIALRAGNVIGGGDFSDDRIIPDIVRAIESNKAVTLRSPQSVRPWQHVLEPIFAYLKVAEKLANDPKSLAPAYNIGPEASDVLSVEKVTQLFIEAYKTGSYNIDEAAAKQLHEAKLLLLDNTKLKQELPWTPKLNAQQAIEWTAYWYANKELSAREKCLQQINEYMKLL